MKSCKPENITKHSKRGQFEVRNSAEKKVNPKRNNKTTDHHLIKSPKTLSSIKL